MKNNTRVLVFISCLCLISELLTAQVNWFAQFGGDEYQRVSMTTRDADNNIYMCGTFRGSFDSDPGTGEHILTSGSYEDFYVIKLNPAGEYIWSFDIGAGWQDFAFQILIDQDGNVNVAGIFQGPVDFDPGDGTFILETLGDPFLSSNMYVAKYSPDGEFMQAIQFRNTEENFTSRSTSLAVDSQGNLIVSGTIDGPIDMDPSAGTFILAPETDFGDAVIAKLTPSGELLWAYRFAGSIGDSGEDVAVDGDDNIYFTGLFRSSIDFDPGAESVVLSPQGANTFNDIFILSLDENGMFRWVKGIGWDGTQNGRFIQMGHDGFLYVSGELGGYANFNPGGSEEMTLTSTGGDDCYLMKLSTDGTVQWARSWGGTGSDRIYGISVGPGNEIITTGAFNSDLTINSGSWNVNLTNAGAFDGYVLSWNDDGYLINGFSFGGEGDDFGRMAHIVGDETYLVAGDFDDDIQLMPGNAAAAFSPVDNDDVFLALYDPFTTTTIIANQSEILSVFPNPSNGATNVRVMNQNIPAFISIYDSGGRLYRSQSLTDGRLNISDLSCGFYNVIVDTDKSRSSFKLIVD